MSQLFLVLSQQRGHRKGPVSAPEMQRPTVMVKAGLMLEARTMAALSPVARIERAGRVPRKPTHGGTGQRDDYRRQHQLIPAARKKLRALLAMEKTVSVLTSDMVDEKPITARLMV